MKGKHNHANTSAHLISTVTPLKLIVERICNWLGSRKLRRYGLRPATESDLDFVMEEVVEGAKQGHYAASLLEPAQAHAFRDQLRNIIRHSAMIRGTDRGVVEQIIARLWIYGCENDGACKEFCVNGFLIFNKPAFCHQTK